MVLTSDLSCSIGYLGFFLWVILSNLVSNLHVLSFWDLRSGAVVMMLLGVLFLLVFCGI